MAKAVSCLPIALSSLAFAALACFPQDAVADEGGVSFWVPGFYGSLAAVPQQPGWSLASIYYHTSPSASGSLAFERQVTVGGQAANVTGSLNANLNAKADLALEVPTYVFATPVFGGQLALSMMGVYGQQKADVNATLTGSVGGVGFTKTGSLAGSLTGFGDLYPVAAIRWNQGVNNFMIYATGDIPVGAYDSTRLVNIGIGHGAIDGGAGYTYLNPQTGHEFSAAGGFTYNLKNPETQYQNGIDFHLDLAASQFLTKQFFVGVVGYTYQQLTADRGGLPILGHFESRVSGVGPQIGYMFPIGDMQGYINLKGYQEFDAEHRAAGWNTWLTFSISPAAPTPTAPPRHLVSK
jgi:hypothetical protein